MEGLSGDVLVLGLGRSGAAVVRCLLHNRAGEAGAPIRSITVVDENANDGLRATADELRATADQLGSPSLRVLLGAGDPGAGPFDVAIVSPGLSPSRPIMRAATERSARVVSELEFAYQRSRSPWVAITGTNGKTTTTSLVHHLLVSAGVPCEKVGNIGTPAIQVVDGATPATTIVAEVSSFQLAFTHWFRPRVSVLLNVTPDHLDWHVTMESYAADKAKIFTNQTADDFAVVDVDDEGSAPYADVVAGRGVRLVRVTRREPSAGGAGVVDGMLVLDTNSGPIDLVRAEELRIRGEHNVSNALAAAAAAHVMGAGADALREGLRTFEPIEHRIEPVGDVGGVEFFNDSKATNPDAVLKALTAFGERPLVVLLGGRNKDNDFAMLARAVSERAKAAVLFGEAREELADSFRGLPVPIAVVASMADAFRASAELAEPGDAVLLSPACASFDEFTGYAHRGSAFRDMVADLARERSIGGGQGIGGAQ